MTNFKMIVACSAALAMSMASLCASAQDDLDDLLKDLEGETAQPAGKPAAAAAPKAAEAEAAEADEPAAKEAAPAAEEPKADEAKAEEEAPAAAEAPVAKAAAEPAVADETDEPKAKEVEEAATTADKVDDVLNLLDQLAEEEAASKTVPKATGVAAADGTAELKAKAVEEAATAEKAVAKPAKPKKLHPESELLENIATTERLRRESLDTQAKREVLAARASMETKEFTDAVRHYGLAIKFLNDSPSSRALRKECDQGIAEGLYRAALQEDEIGRRAKAVDLMQKALEMRHPKARRALEKWTAQSDVDVAKTDFSEASQRRNDEDYKAEREVFRRHLRRARQYLALRDMSRALDECESVLKSDPYNQEAIRLRRAIQNKRQTILQQERVAARDGMIADVDEAWRPVYAVDDHRGGRVLPHGVARLRPSRHPD